MITTCRNLTRTSTWASIKNGKSWTWKAIFSKCLIDWSSNTSPNGWTTSNTPSNGTKQELSAMIQTSRFLSLIRKSSSQLRLWCSQGSSLSAFYYTSWSTFTSWPSLMAPFQSTSTTKIFEKSCYSWTTLSKQQSQWGFLKKILEDFSKFHFFQTIHKFLFTPEQAEYPNQWYSCTGICNAYEPFHGTVRCTSIPDESHLFFEQHEEKCGGQFFRIFEMSRTNAETNETEKVYVRNTSYMFPKPRTVGRVRKGHHQVRELFDLTDDAEDSAVIKNLCDFINLDDSEYANEAKGDDKLVNNFIRQSLLTFAKCPFCTVTIGTKQIAEHFDKCRGYQQNVVFKR